MGINLAMRIVNARKLAKFHFSEQIAVARYLFIATRHVPDF